MKKERRIINIDKEEFDIIKKYCEKYSFTMNKWISHSVLDIIWKMDENLKCEIVKTKYGKDKLCHMK